MEESKATERLVILDGIRGIAALAVVLFHVIPRLIMHGFLAVDVFFLLSGYVIAGAYGARLKSGQGLSWFFGVRMARLYPLYVLGLILGLAAQAPYLGFTPVFEKFLGALVFYHPMSTLSINGALWTLPVELGVNLLYAAGGYRLSNRALALVVAGAGAVFLAAIILMGWGSIGNGNHPDWVRWSRVLFSFPLGVLAYRLHRAGRLPRPNLSPGLLVGVMTAVYFIPTWHVRAIDALLVLVILPACFFLILPRSDIDPGRISTLATWAGRLSYPIYCVHQPVDQLFHYLLKWGDGAMPPPGAFMIVPPIVALTFFAHLVVEPWGKKFVMRVTNELTRRHLVATGIRTS
jgi:peptidoglycan/LPS O-acetylase OafA/YrhL